MNTTLIMREAKRLHRLGFAIIWLHPGSKRPVDTGWTTGPRKSWAELQAQYQNGMNMGVRLGTPSKIEDRGFLCVLDLDVKSTEERHLKEAVQAAKRALKGAPCPVVLSGRGNGSRHYYCVTKEAFDSFNGEKSGELVRVMMPSASATKKGTQGLSPKEIAQGWRIRPAWEVSMMSEGRQTVLPPSVHPDSGKPYAWRGAFTDTGQLPNVEFDYIKDVEKRPASPLGAAGAASTKGKEDEAFQFQESAVNIDWLDISDRVKKGIITGEGVEDRSAFLLPACSALISAGCTNDEVLSVLTDPKTWLGACAYEHAKTQDRARAARWLWRYTLKRVAQERDAVAAFKNAAKVEPNRKLSPEEAEEQSTEIESEKSWRDQLERTQGGNYKNSYLNCRIILDNVCSGPIVGRNEFAANDYFLCGAPWGSLKGQAVTDVDSARIKNWLADQYGLEYGQATINEALTVIADQNRYHPVRDWIKSLKWDGVERIGTWLKDYGGAEGPEPYLTEVSRKFLVAMVTRVFRPGTKFDTILVLEGDQGVGKSTMLAKLVGDEWFTDAAIKVGDKDAVLSIQSKWLMELGELSALSKSDLELFKVFISQRVDRIRAPYGKRIEEFPRQVVFAGTTNLDEYLRDLTGNRRFWSVKLTAKKINFAGIAKVRKQLFAEAYQSYLLGEELYFVDDHVYTQAVTEQAKRLHSDEWIGAVQDIVNSEGFPLGAFEMRDVAKRLDQFGAHRLTNSDCQRLARCLKLLGFEKFQETGGQRRKLWRATKSFFPIVKNGHANGHVNGNGNGLQNGHAKALNGTGSNRVEPSTPVPRKPATKAEFEAMEPWNRDFL